MIDPLDLARRLREATYGTERHAIGELVKEIERLRAIEKAARDDLEEHHTCRCAPEWTERGLHETHCTYKGAADLRAALREKGAEE